MAGFWYLAAAAIGLVWGSFINTVADRLPQRTSLLWPRSACPGCGRRLAWWELVPVASFLALRGRCRSCQRPIGWRTPAVEAGLGLIGVIITAQSGFTPTGGLTLGLAGGLVALAVIDLEHRLLPQALTLPLLGGGVAWSALAGPGLQTALWGLVVCGGLIWAVGLVYRRLTGREGLGGGDPKLAAGLGAWLGPEAGLMTVVLGAGTGAVLGLIFIALGRASLKTALPFGPFLAFWGLVWLLIRPLAGP